MKTHPHNTRVALYRSMADVPADVLEAYRAGRMLIPREAFGGYTGAWTDLEWLNVSLMPSDLEVGDVIDEWATGRWVYRGDHDETGRPLFNFESKGA